MERSIRACTSASLGQMSLRYTGLPSLPVPSGSVVRSTSRVPASAYATTSGGEARKFMRVSGCTRPSKLRLPDSTEQAVKAGDLTACSALEVAVAGQHRAGRQIARLDGGRDLRLQRAGITDTARTPVADDVKTNSGQIIEHARLGEVIGHHT